MALLRAPGTSRAAAIVILALPVIAIVHPFLFGTWTYFGGALRVAAALLLGYGLLKYGIFDVDVKLKWTLDRGALLCVFGAAFFIVEQIAEFYVSAALGTLAGFAAAALLLVAFKPLRRLSAKIADRAFPGVRATPDHIGDRKLVVYRTAALAAARDGTITERERGLLDPLRKELDVPEAEVARIDREVFARTAT